MNGRGDRLIRFTSYSLAQPVPLCSTWSMLRDIQTRAKHRIRGCAAVTLSGKAESENGWHVPVLRQGKAPQSPQPGPRLKL